jgi:hypothetical protein
MNALETIEQFQCKIDLLNKAIEDKKKELVKWCQENSKEIKKQFPIRDKIYLVTEYNNYQNHFHFKPKCLRFVPTQSFGYHRMPTVKGDLLDDKFRFLEDDIELQITVLKDINANELAFDERPTKMYLMIDKNTGYYKIGRSVDPRARERTLQSEKPTIELLNVYDTKIKHERILHGMFKEKRIRGEWFDLSGSDVQSINTYFTQKIN